MPTTEVWTTSNVTVADPIQLQDHLLTSFVSNVVITVLIAIFLVVGTFGTLSTAVVISLNKHLHTKANIFIASLCLSDLISALICSPLWLYRRTWGFEEWEWGNLACKFYWVCDFTTNYVTSLHIVSFAALRCVAMMAPFRIKKISTRMVFVYICFLWLISIGTALPLGLLMSVDFERVLEPRGTCWPSCSVDSNRIDEYYTYINVVNAVMFYLPEVFIVIFTLLIVHVLQKKKSWRKRYVNNVNNKISKDRIESIRGTAFKVDVIPNPYALGTNSTPNITPSSQRRLAITNSVSLSISIRNNLGFQSNTSRNRRSFVSGAAEKKAFIQLALIALAYFFGYVPVTAYLSWSVGTPKENKRCLDDYLFGVTSYLCLRISECMNPLMYNLGSSQISEATKKLFKNKFLKHNR